jgi:hypothetical protein
MDVQELIVINKISTILICFDLDFDGIILQVLSNWRRIIVLSILWSLFDFLLL